MEKKNKSLNSSVDELISAHPDEHQLTDIKEKLMVIILTKILSQTNFLKFLKNFKNFQIQLTGI